MTTINAYNGTRLTIHDNGLEYGRADLTMARTWGTDHTPVFGNFDLPEVLDALGAVPTADMAREIGEEVARRKAAEAERDEYRMAAEAEAEGLNEWKERAERAEAAVERVRAILPSTYPNGKPLIYGLIEDALADKPAFTLPTEAPARIEAKRVHHGYTTVLTLFTDGTGDRFWRAEYNGEDWKDAGVMECFTDHRLIGADE